MANRRRFITTVISASTVAIAGCTDTDGESNFEIREIDVSPTFAQSQEEITVAVTVANVGDDDGTTSVDLSLDVTESTVESETIGAGETTQITSDIQAPVVNSGRYELTATLDNEQSSSASVDLYEELDRSGLHGSVISEAEESLENSVVRMISTDQEFADNNVNVDSDERFFSPHLRNGSYELRATFYANSDSDTFSEIPDVAPLQSTYPVSDDVEILGQYEIPTGHRTEIRLVDQDGNPVSNLQSVSVRDQIGNGQGYRTTDDGYLIHTERSEQGVILPEDSTFDVDAHPEDGDRPVVFGEVHGSTDDEFVLEVSDPSRFPTT